MYYDLRQLLRDHAVVKLDQEYACQGLEEDPRRTVGAESADSIRVKGGAIP